MMTSRRDFLKAAALVPAVGLANAATTFHLGTITYNVLKDQDLEGIIRILEATNFEGVELRTGHKHGVEPSLSSAERANVRKRFGKSKVRLYSFGTECE